MYEAASDNILQVSWKLFANFVREWFGTRWCCLLDSGALYRERCSGTPLAETCGIQRAALAWLESRWTSKRSPRSKVQPRLGDPGCSAYSKFAAPLLRRWRSNPQLPGMVEEAMTVLFHIRFSRFACRCLRNFCTGAGGSKDHGSLSCCSPRRRLANFIRGCVEVWRTTP